MRVSYGLRTKTQFYLRESLRHCSCWNLRWPGGSYPSKSLAHFRSRTVLTAHGTSPLLFSPLSPIPSVSVSSLLLSVDYRTFMQPKLGIFPKLLALLWLGQLTQIFSHYSMLVFLAHLSRWIAMQSFCATFYRSCYCFWYLFQPWLD